MTIESWWLLLGCWWLRLDSMLGSKGAPMVTESGHARKQKLYISTCLELPGSKYLPLSLSFMEPLSISYLNTPKLDSLKPCNQPGNSALEFWSVSWCVSRMLIKRKDILSSTQDLALIRKQNNSCLEKRLRRQQRNHKEDLTNGTEWSIIHS